MLLLSGDAFEAVGVFAAIGTTILMLYAGFLGVRWIHRRMDGPKAPDPDQMGDLHERLARLEEAEHRLAELEERLDFTERVLADSRPPVALPKGDA